MDPIDTSSYPAWLAEPAKMVGWVVATVLAITGAIAVLGAEVTDIVPEKYKHWVAAVVAGAAAVSVIATRVQALLTRNGIGPTGNGKDGVYSPATIDAARGVLHPADSKGDPAAALDPPPAP